jgi:transposase
MDLLVDRVAGLDVGKDEVVVAVRTPDGSGGRRQEIRTFATFTPVLEQMAAWLGAEGVSEVVMEATGQYWLPVWYVLEDAGFDLKLVNARHVKILPGRKTDVADAAWLAELLEHGLLRGSFVPPHEIRELRDLTRYRKRLIQDHTREAQRVQKTLESGGIRLDSVASDVLGVSGRAMLRALLGGERDPEVLAGLAKGRLRNKTPDLRLALKGRFNDHHALLIGLALDHVEHLETAIAALDAEVERVMAPFAVARDLLDTIPGVAKRAAEVTIAEIGVDMTGFPTPAHLASWGCAPVTTSPAGNVTRVRPIKATGGSERPSTSAPGPRPTLETPIWPPSSGVSPAASARRKRPLRSVTPSWSSPGT